jgi:hypothetical protein
MDSIENRYNNFKQFCLKLKPENEYVQMLQTVTLPAFVQAIKLRLDERQSTDTIFEAIVQKCEIDVKDVLVEDMAKFKRYIEYFSDVVRALE